MLTHATPATYRVPADGRLTDDLVEHERARPDRVALSRRSGSSWQDVTSAELAEEVREVAAGLLAAGVGRGDRVALMSRTRAEWTVLDYAIWWVGAVTVPVYESSSAEQLGWILADSGASACVVETAEHAARLDAVRADASDLRTVWSLEDGAIAALTAAGADVAPDRLEARRTEVGPSDLATLVYTSGTTGRPRGCRLTHANILAEVGAATDALDALFDGDESSTLLFLPLAHVFARIVQVGAIHRGARLGHTADVTDLVGTLGAFRPTFVLAVPRVFEKIYNSASLQARAAGRGRIFDAATETAIAYSRALDDGRLPLALRIRHRVFDRLVYGRLRAALGGATAWAIAGGAPLGERLAHFFRGVGLPVLEGYGLTETSAAVSVNLPGETKIGTVGRPLPGTAVRVAEDGELLVRGPQVFDGYWADDEATAAVLQDGWFSTGDLGEIDEEGFIRVTGRKKEILVTAGGKNVAPAVLEDRVRAHPLVSQCMVVGDGKPFIAALVTLDAEALPGWLRAQGREDDLSPRDAVRDPDVLLAVQGAVDEANKQVSRAESVRKFALLARDWTQEDGYLTPTLKLRRARVLGDHVDEVEALYL